MTNILHRISLIRSSATLAIWLAFPVVPQAAAFEVANVMPSVVSVIPQWQGRAPNLDEPEGSGVVVGPGRFILTANHVLGNAVRVMVRTSDGLVMDATIKGRDRTTDLALLEVDDPLPAIAFAGDPVPGEPVCALGNAFGLGLSVSCGTVSAIHRSDIGFNELEDFVQTDAAVNPGSSGGALVSRDGKLVGVLSAIFTKASDANIGVNFAVSAPLSQRVLASLSDARSVAWPEFGARLEKAPPKGMTGRTGARVAAVSQGGPAAAAGIQPGDLIVMAADRRVRSPGSLRAALARLADGESLSLRVVRGDAQITLHYTNN